MSSDGYQAGQRSEQGVGLRSDGVDQLALTTVGSKVWVEESGLKSKIVSVGSDLAAERLELDNAEFPVASPDGRWLAYLRSEHGRGRIWLHGLTEAVSVDIPITPPSLNVFEMSFYPDGSIAFAAAEEHQAPHLFLIKDKGRIQQIMSEEARYPSISPDGQWLAYSRRSGGVWNLWLRRINSVDERRITDADCNDVWPSWGADSRTLLFASDCGRAFGLTALYRQRVLP
jgi:Tol biopolymer transport system component